MPMSIKQKARKYWEIWQNYEEKDLAYRVALLISTLLIVFLSVALAVSALNSALYCFFFSCSMLPL